MTANLQNNYLLEMRNIAKEFSGVYALKDVNLSVKEGEIHALVGENGAGKSTLMNVLSGVYPFGSYTGEIHYGGEMCKFHTIKESEHKGIVIIHQELALIPYLSIAENVFLGNERGTYLNIDWDAANAESKTFLTRVGLTEPPQTLIKDIGVGKQQLVEIAKALAKKVGLLILDEPTASLNETDSQALLELLIELKRVGVTSIIISHKLNEISYVADRITVIRDGTVIKTLDKEKDSFDEPTIIHAMVGRDLSDRFPKRPQKNTQGASIPQDGIDFEKRTPRPEDIALEVKNWNVDHPIYEGRKVCDSVNLYIRKGEVVGISGLMGAGRTELAMSVFGKSYGSNISGQIFMNGKEVHLNTVQQAIDHKLAYVTEDRKGNGLVLMNPISTNTTLAKMDKVSTRAVIDEDKEIAVAEKYRKDMRTKSTSVYQNVGSLSGGNQQKVLLAKWMFADPEVLILDEPTRGIDVGAKYDIYVLINELVAEGKSVIMISSEMPEVLGMCDRIYVMNEGRIVAEMPAKDASQHSIMAAILASEKKS